MTDLRTRLMGMVIAGLALGCASQSRAAMTVFGGGAAEDCYKSVKAGLSDIGAIAVCDSALQDEAMDNRDRGGTYVNRGVLKMRRGALAEAHADFDAGVKLAPLAGEAWINRGAVLLAEKRYTESLADINKGIQLGIKELEKAYFNRALVYEGMDDEKSAYADYQQALVIKPDWEAPKKELLRFTVTRR